MLSRKQFLSLTALSVDSFVSMTRSTRKHLPLMYSQDGEYALRDALLTLVALQFSGSMGLTNERAASIARSIDAVLSNKMSKLRDPRIDRVDEAIFVGRMVVAPKDRLGTADPDTGLGTVEFFGGLRADLMDQLERDIVVKNFQIVNVTNIAHELRRRCNQNGIAYQSMFDADDIREG